MKCLLSYGNLCCNATIKFHYVSSCITFYKKSCNSQIIIYSLFQLKKKCLLRKIAITLIIQINLSSTNFNFFKFQDVLNILYYVCQTAVFHFSEIKNELVAWLLELRFFVFK